MKIAVTGASGFVGRHVVAVLATDPAVDLVASSRHPAHAADLPTGVRHVPMDLGAAAKDPYERLGSPDIVIHLAWEGLPNYTARRHFEVELPVQYAFLRALVDAGLPSLVVTGTCYEYGMASGPLAENLEGTPSNPYGFAKLTLLRQLEFLQRDRPFALTWARLFYMWGEGQAPTSIYSQLMRAIRHGDLSFPMSGGEQLRDFLPVSTVAQKLVALALSAPGAGRVNICMGTPTSIRGFVETIVAAQGADLELDRTAYAYPTHEPMAFWGVRDRLDHLIGKRDA